jgi:PAS domain-containing protein
LPALGKSRRGISCLCATAFVASQRRTGDFFLWLAAFNYAFGRYDGEYPTLMPKQSRGSAMDHERMLRLLADSVPQIICTAGPNGKIDYFNRRWFEFTGLGEAQTL